MAKITFVDENDNVIGAGTKKEALEKSIAHRIARIYLFNSKGEILMQKRSATVTSNPNKWDQSAAGHVDEGETYEQAAYRELKEEVGIEGIPLKEIAKYYQEETDERRRKRFNMLYMGTYDGDVIPDGDEVSEVKWFLPEELERRMKEHPDEFTQGSIRSFQELSKWRAAVARQKTPDEVAAIEETQRAVEAAMAAVVSYLRSTEIPTSEEAHAVINMVLAEMGCESPEGLIVAGGLHGAEPHEEGAGIVKRGEPIVIDIYPRSKKSGYFADMTRTVCIGEPSPRAQKMFDAVRGAQELAISMVKPGVACRDMQEAVERYFTEAGFITSGKGKEFPYAEGFVHGVGHGVGLDVHEAPRIGRTSADILMEGDVITIEPGLYYKDIGGVRLEDMVLVTKDGCRNLTQCSKEFVVSS